MVKSSGDEHLLLVSLFLKIRKPLGEKKSRWGNSIDSYPQKERCPPHPHTPTSKKKRGPSLNSPRTSLGSDKAQRPGQVPRARPLFR